MSKKKLYVAEGDRRIPFLRGMVTHSLMARGLSFQQAYRAASLVRDRIRKRKKAVSKSDLSRLIREVVGDEFGPEYLEEPPASIPATIIVRGQATEMPFSKGILTQSLQAAGLDPSVAHDIARQIEGSLLERGEREISRDELRRLIYETLLGRHQPGYGDRYLLWRYFKAPDKPLILIFGGGTGTGKSSVAAEVAHRLGIQQILPTDTIRQMMRMMFSRDLLPTIHSSSYEAWKDAQITGDEGRGVVEAFREQAVRVLVGVRAIVERAVQENTSLVIEGVHLVPGLMGLEEMEDRAHIVPVVISTLNRAAYLERFPRRQQEAGRRSARRYRENFDTILQIQDYILDMAESHDSPIVENDNLDETVSSILTVVSNRLKEKLNITSDELISRTL